MLTGGSCLVELHVRAGWTVYKKKKQAQNDTGSPADATINTESAPAHTVHLAAHGQPITYLTQV